MAANVEYILDDLDYYSEAYQTFTRCAAKTGAIQDWIDASFSDTVVKKLSARVQTKEPLKVLGIGSGAGNLDCAILEKLLPAFPKIENTFVEPSEAQNTLFKDLVAEKGEALKGASFEWRAETSDQFLEGVRAGASQGKKYHLITAIHVLYYAADLKQTLQMLFDLLEEGGLLFIVALSRDSTIIKVHRKMNEVYKDMRKLLLTDEQVVSALDSLKMPNEYQRVFRYIHGTAIFDESSEEGRHLLDFLTHSKDFRKTAPDNLRDTILKYIRDPECSDEKEGEVMVFRHWVHITVPK